MTTSLIWILYRSDSDNAYKETLNCKKIIEGYGKKVLFSEISTETTNINQLFSASEILPEITIVLGGCLLYTSPSPRDQRGSRMPSSA